MEVIKDGKKLRCGFTTGSCATACAKAACELLEDKREIEDKSIFIRTNTGEVLNLTLLKLYREGEYAIATIIKDAGDDLDITDGIEVGVKLKKNLSKEIEIIGGPGVGIIKRKGLFGNVGDPAINPGPRKMISDSIREVSQGGYIVEIFVPEGEEIANNTFNKNLGIEGGISILGSTGIVMPMSDEALKKTIYLEMDLRRQDGDEILLVPGNYGEKIARDLGYSLEPVKVSNFIGEAIQYAYNKDFKKIILIGHIGKLSKVSVGAFNTHNRVCDLRMEAFIYYLSLLGAPKDHIKLIDGCLTSEEAAEKIIALGYKSFFQDMKLGIKTRLLRYIKAEDFNFEIHLYTMERGLLT